MQRKYIRQVVEEVDGWLSLPVANLLARLAHRQSRFGTIVEIGAFKGKSTICIAKALSGLKNTFYSIDPHSGSIEHNRQQKIDTYHDYISNLEKYSALDNVITVRKTSKEAYTQIPDGITMLWIDGSHEYEDVLFDFQEYFKKLTPGGVVVFHDSNWPGVKKVLWERVYPLKGIGVIKKIEQTTYFYKCENHSPFFRLINLIRLYFLKKNQNIKRIRRQWRRRHPRWTGLL